MTDSDEANVDKKSRDRSPNHPVISLPEAIERAKEIKAKYAVHQAPIAHIHRLWNYKEHSGKGNQQIAALKAYGLINVTGSAKDRKVAISERADRILRNAPDKTELLKKAALSPPIHTEILEEYKENGLPPDDLLRRYLVWDREEGTFNEEAVDKFIENFRETLLYAGIEHGDKIEDEDDRPNDEENRTKPSVNDFVQWTSHGVDQFPAPKQVIGFSEDGEWAFLAGENTGVAVSKLTVVDPPERGKPTNVARPMSPPSNPHYDPPKPDGPFISFPLSGGNRFELRLVAPVSKKDFERLKALIELSEDSLVQE